MTKEEYRTWASLVVTEVANAGPEFDQLAKEVEPHDKKAAALLRKHTAGLRELASHLAKQLD